MRVYDGKWREVIGVELDDVSSASGEDPPKAWIEPDEFVNWLVNEATDEQILAIRERILRFDANNPPIRFP